MQIVKTQDFFCVDWSEFKLYPALPDTIDICQIRGGGGKERVINIFKDFEILIDNIFKYLISTYCTVITNSQVDCFFGGHIISLE